MSVTCGLTGERVTDPARIAIMRTRRIRWADHFSWPWMVAMGNENQAEDLVPRNMMADLDADDAIYIPGLHGVYVFHTVDGMHLTWYARANMVAFNGKLYHVVYQHGNLLAAYTWLARQRVADACFVTVLDTDLRCRLQNGNVLRISGSTVYRYSGELKDDLACVNCIRMVPPVQWWQAPSTFFDDLGKVYAPQDRITRPFLNLQRTIRRWSNKKREERLHVFRSVGLFALLNDDLFMKITDMAFRSTSSRCVQIELGLGSRRLLPEVQVRFD
jgi:hypothetical protein